MLSFLLVSRPGISRNVGPYQLVRRLGIGGMAETWLAVRSGIGGFRQRVCVKCILPAYEDDDRFVKLFLEEARIVAHLRHANIVQVLDFGRIEATEEGEGGTYYMALELVEGADLRALLRAAEAAKETIPVALFVYIALELASALDAAHNCATEEGTVAILHRDISPSNVLISYAGEIKLSDFGIAKATTSATGTSTQAIKGKAPYMAPEYALRGEYEQRSDLFALGVTLYECIAGVRPFTGAHDLEILQRISTGTYAKLADARPDVPQAVSSLVDRLLAPEVKDRPSNAAALVEELAHLAPPATARKTLGDLLGRLRPRNLPTPGASTPPPSLPPVAPAAVSANSEQRTQALDTGALGTEIAEGGIAPAPVVAYALRGPNEPTRTLAQEPTTQALDDAASVLARSDATHTTNARPTIPDEKDPAHAPLAASVPGSYHEPGSVISGHVAVATSKLAAPSTYAAGPNRSSRIRFAMIATVAVLGSLLLVVRQLGRASSASSTHPADNAASALSASTARQNVHPEPTRTPEVQEAQHNSPTVSATAAISEPTPTLAAHTTGATTPPDTSTEMSTGRLRIVVVPFGRVWIDGRLQSAPPVSVRVAPGEHQVLVKSGPKTERRLVTVASGKTEVAVFRFSPSN